MGWWSPMMKHMSRALKPQTSFCMSEMFWLLVFLNRQSVTSNVAQIWACNGRVGQRLKLPVGESAVATKNSQWFTSPDMFLFAWVPQLKGGCLIYLHKQHRIFWQALNLWISKHFVVKAQDVGSLTYTYSNPHIYMY